MVPKKIMLWIIVLIILTSIVLSTTSVSIINSPPIFLNTTIYGVEGTNTNLTPYTYDPNWDFISCSYCYLGSCTSSCTISTLTIKGTYLVEVTLNDSENFTVTNITLIVKEDLVGPHPKEPPTATPQPVITPPPIPPPTDKKVDEENTNITNVPNIPIENNENNKEIKKPILEQPGIVKKGEKEKKSLTFIPIGIIGFIVIGGLIFFILTRRRHDDDDEQDVKVRHAPVHVDLPRVSHSRLKPKPVESGPDMTGVKQSIKNKLRAEKKKTPDLSGVKDKIQSKLKDKKQKTQKTRPKVKPKSKAKPKIEDVGINMAIVKRKIKKKLNK